MKLKNNGFAISVVLYGLLVLFLILVVAMLGILSSYRSRMNKLIDEGDNGARENVKKQIEIDSMTVIMVDNEKNRCKSEEKTWDVQVYSNEGNEGNYLEIAKNRFMNETLLKNYCKYEDGCYFFKEDLDNVNVCESVGGQQYKCTGRIFNNCISAENAEVDPSYDGKKIYKNDVEETNND